MRQEKMQLRVLNKFLGDLRIGLVDVEASGGLEPRWHSGGGNSQASAVFIYDKS
jgi:hypothetical protein